MLEQLLSHVRQGSNLDPQQVCDAVKILADPAQPVEGKADFLAALASKGETPEEIAVFAAELRALSIPVTVPESLRTRGVLDVCGTGGDQLHTFNISTTVALVTAAAGVCVAKHGNRAITSKAGAADVLEALGVRIDLTPAEVASWLEQHHFAFIFAPGFHPAFQHIGPARRLCAERGQRTLFNFMGPLLNPARPDAQLLGVSNPRYCLPLARVLQSIGVRRGMVVSGEVPASAEGEATRHMDEWSILGETTVAEFYQDRAMSETVVDISEFSMNSGCLADLKGGDREENARMLRSILRGDDRGARRDAVLLNAGAALFVAGRVRSMTEGLDLAAETIDNGRACAKLEELVAASAR